MMTPDHSEEDLGTCIPMVLTEFFSVTQEPDTSPRTFPKNYTQTFPLLKTQADTHSPVPF